MDFPGNSQNVTGKTGNQPRKDVEKIVTGEVVHKKPPLGRRIRNIVLGGDLKTAASHVAQDVLLPALRNAIYDAFIKGIEQMMWGDAPQRRRPGYGYGYTEPRPKISYNRASESNRPRRGETHPLAKQDVGEVVMISRADAESVLSRMADIADQFENVSVADMYELVGLPTSHIDSKWGWSGLHDVAIRQVREGYLIDLPPAEPI